MSPRDTLSPPLLQQGGLSALFGSFPPELARRARAYLLQNQPIPLAEQFRLFTRLHHLRNRLRYDAVTDPWDVIWVDPTEVTQYTTAVELPWGLGRVAGGDWDQPKHRGEIRKLARYRGLVQRFVDGREWEETVYYEDLRARYGDGPVPRGFDDFESFWADRRESHEQLYESMREDGYRPNHLTNRDPQTWGEYVHSLEPLLGIGRHGELLWNEGYGRLIVASILGVEEIPVYVLCRHEQWQRTRATVVSEGAVEVDSLAEHPDLRDCL
ncbi:hypothetical protein [Haloarchaeobius sp. TZWWS8]|uniref:hypothetical protein n=1 Tax=Haloarchaeobius sp. TZWWS8 TaxID=3446121 RepID=UPI003EC0E1C3